MTLRQAAENLAQSATPVPVGVSGAVFIGITLKDWVLLATAILLVFQLVVMAPKAFRSLCIGARYIQKVIRRIRNRYGRK